MPGKRKIRGRSGHATKYVSRAKVTRHLRLSLNEFNKLCILKGIYPRVPRNKGTTNTLHYHTNDVSFIKNDKLLDDMGELKAHKDRLMHKKNRGELKRGELFNTTRPELNIDHIIRERYPTYQDALEDIDDAVTSALLYASLTTSKYLSASELAEFRRLSNEFCLFCMATRAVTKVFFSTRGIYYAVQLPGCSKETVFVAPHDLVQKMPMDVDKNVIHSFALLHKVLLKNIMPKLYTDIGLEYPPELPNLTTVSLVPACHELQKKLVRPDSLPLSGIVCLVGRECPRRTLEMTVEGAGGYIANFGVEGEMAEMPATPITHIIIDRPVSDSVVARMFEEFKQQPSDSVIVTVPQYMLDCVNAQCLLPPAPYIPITPVDGTAFRPPPHRSPFTTASAIPKTTIRRDAAIPNYERPVENVMSDISKALGSTPSRKDQLKLELKSMSRRNKRLLNRNVNIEKRERVKEALKKKRADAYHARSSKGVK